MAACDIELAREVQRALEPPAEFRLGPVHVATSMQVCTDLGGDFLCFRRASRWVGVLIGDVMGKGVQAALAAAYLEGIYEALARSRTPAEVLDSINSRFYGRFRGRLFCTLLCLQLDLGRQRWVVARAGHPPALLVRANGQLQDLRAEGLPAGILPDLTYRCAYAPIEPGDNLLLVTDGLWDGDAPEALVPSLLAHRHRPVGQALRAWMEDLHQCRADDCTAAWLRIDG